MERPKLYIICTSDEPNNVIFGHASFASKAGFDPVFLFPNRQHKNEFTEFFDNTQYIRLGFTFSTTNVFTYLISIFLLLIFVTRALYHAKHCHVLAVDLISTISCLFLRIRGFKITCLVNDNFSASYPIGNSLFFILRWFEAFVYKRICDACIFPHVSRYHLLGKPTLKKVYFIPNVLIDENSYTYTGSPTTKLQVMFCGWLAPSRGLEHLKEILNCTTSRVEFILVGSGDDVLIDELVKNPRVEYIGRVSRKKNLELMTKVDINMALYNPNVPINRVALPQKIYDSLLVGCPLIVNSEVEMSEDLNLAGCCFSVEYSDIPSICHRLNSLVENKEILAGMSNAITKFQSEQIGYRQVQSMGVDLYQALAKAVLR